MTAQLPGSDKDTLGAVRQQLESSLYVEAGAGTGKTHALVARLTELLDRGGVRPGKIAAITFTRAAAFEMRSRVRAGLEQRARDAGGDEERRRLDGIVEELDNAAIQTIHSFALSMLEERPLEAGLPPVITPLDQIEAGIDFDERWREWLNKRLSSDDGSSDDFRKALSKAHRLGLSKPLEILRDLAEKFSDRRHMLQPGMFAAGGTGEAPMPVARLRDALSQISTFADRCAVPEDTLCRHVTETVCPAITSLVSAAGDATEITAEDLLDLPKITPGNNRGSKANWERTQGGGEALEVLRHALEELQDEINAILDSLRSWVTAVLLSATLEFTLEYAEERRRQGRPTYEDQLVWARDLLRDSPPALAHFRERYQHILVDEFQDTDPLQIEILRLLASDGDGSLRPGSLFLVGDPKQSIYRFRGADPSVTGRLAGEVAGASQRLTLRENRRSLKHVLDWVNGVFGPWMAADKDGGQAAYEPLSPAEEVNVDLNDGPAPSVWCFGDDSAASADEARECEFAEIAQIARAAGDGAFRVREKDGPWRDSHFGDVAILVKTRTGIELLEEELTSAGVPYVFEGQSPLFTSQDVRDLHACLTAIDDPTDQVAVLAALRSPAFSCSDADLWRWKEAGGSFAYLDDFPATAHGPVADAFTSLRSYHTLSRAVPVPRLIEQFVRERRMREKAALSRRGPERLRRINMAVELAAVMSADAPLTLRDFAEWVRQQSDENARMPESVSEAAATEAVRVMTAHGSKGLEFPIVVMAAAKGAAPDKDQAKTQQRRDGNGDVRLEAQLGNEGLGMRTAGFAAAAQEDRAQNVLQDVRLMYVAATRARDYLFVSLWRTGRDAKAPVGRIAELADGCPGLWQRWTPLPPRAEPLHRNGSVASTRADREQWLTERTGLTVSASLRRYVTASGLEQHGASLPALPKEESDAADGEPGRFGRGSAERGRAVHAVLQRADLAAGRSQDLSALAQRMADEHGIPGEAAQVQELALRVLSTGIMRRAGDAARRGRAWREVGVAAPLAEAGGGELEGQLDLVFEGEEGGLTIVDYKTDRVEGRTKEEAAAPYLPQMGAYARAVEQATGHPVTAAVLVFASMSARTDDPEYPIPDLQRWKDEAARMARERLAGILST